MTMTSYFPMTDALTSREREITGLASTGLSNKEIAQHLNISESTVKSHLHNIFIKLRVNNRTALAATNRSRR
jgi:two-component system nitrate/nitrite response regulator NarL